MSNSVADAPQLFEALEPVVERLAASVGEVPNERQKILDEAVEFVAERLAADEPAQLVFICTHNSRRSHLGQVWAQVASDYHQLAGVEAYSGGTEATACNIRTVRALRRAGLEVVARDVSNNPRYLVAYAENRKPMEVYSKTYDSESNPQQGYAAMMCCADVDERCPVVHGATVRIPLHYADPKAADDSPQEAARYDERCDQIGREMFYLFSRVAQRLKQ